MPTAGELAAAFAKQARADLDAANALAVSEARLPACQRLHFLQMACEKLVKAHLLLRGDDPHVIQTSHGYVAKNLSLVLRAHLTATGEAKTLGWLTPAAAAIAREVELLAPAVRRGGRRLDNCEYPWVDAAGELRVPAEHTYAVEGLLGRPAGRQVLKLIDAAVSRLVGG